MLSISNTQGVEIDYCPECRGVWLDRGELEKIIERSGSAGYYNGQTPVYGHPEGHSDHHGSDRHSGHSDHDRHYPEGGHNPRHKKGFLSDLFDF